MLDSPQTRRSSLATTILIGLLIGGAAGVALNVLYAPGLGETKSETYLAIESWADRVVKPVGDLFLRGLFMVVVPIVFSSLYLGVAGLGSVGRIGSLGRRTMQWFFGTTALAAVIGLLLVALVDPAGRISPEAAAVVQQQYLGLAQEKIAVAEQSKSWVQMLVEIVPDNIVGAAGDNRRLLGLILFALVLGAAATRLPTDHSRVLRELLETVYELCIKVLGWVMQLAPLGVACLIFHSAVKLGFDVMRLVGWYFVTAMGGLVLYQLIVITGLAWVFARIRPGRFYRGVRTLVVTAFSTSSSSATMPTTIRTSVEEFGAPKEIAGFVMPLGATMNMNGTALFEGVSVLFLANVAGVQLGLGDQVLVIGLAVLTAIGAAGVPGGSLPLLAVVLTQVGVPAEMLALILGVDRLVDMTRTVPNVTSDLVCSLWLSRREGHELRA